MNTAWLLRLRHLPRRIVDLLRTAIDALLAPAPRALPLLCTAASPAENAYAELPSQCAHAGEDQEHVRNAKSVIDVESPFWGLQAPPDLVPASYPTIFSLLQRLPGPKLLDLTPVRLLSLDFFDALAASWTVSGAKVPRLALVLSFERWVMLFRPAIEALQPIVALGVEVVVAYQEQHTGANSRTGSATASSATTPRQRSRACVAGGRLIAPGRT